MSLFGDDRPIVGVLHLRPLPGAPGYEGELDGVAESLMEDVRALVDGGVDALLLENFGDAPFYPDRVPSEVTAHMTALATAVRIACDLPLGINVLRNDATSALAVAHAAGAQFIRVNVLCGVRVTDQGLIEGKAHELMRRRSLLNAHHIAVWADVDVKHSSPLAAAPLGQEVHDLLHRGRADGLIVSGAGTGERVDLDHVQQVKAAAERRPVLVGSGVNAANIGACLEVADGAIVGTALKTDGAVTAPVDPARVAAVVQAARHG
ncbi:MAG: BtpA/SgcQ family protein [Alphaproteobacteria bacterium]|nr:BtpA/SgcQ family protein [Alphaproteobacteria bacterium]